MWCPHEWKAKRSKNYDPLMWEGRGDMCCGWRFATTIGTFILFSPIWVPLVLYGRACEIVVPFVGT